MCIWCSSCATSDYWARLMAHPAPSNAEPSSVATTRSHQKARNTLKSWALELNLMPYGSEGDFYSRIFRCGTALQIVVHFCFHPFDFVEEVLGNLGVVIRLLVVAQRHQRILKCFNTLARHL